MTYKPIPTLTIDGQKRVPTTDEQILHALEYQIDLLQRITAHLEIITEVETNSGDD